MIVLALDTTGPACSAAIVNEVRVIARSRAVIGRGHAEYLAPQVHDLLKESALTISDIDRIAVCTGPGSFTGLRVALALAKGLSLPNNTPVIGVSALEVWQAMVDPERARRVLSVADVRRGELFWQGFDKGAAVTPPTLSNRDTLPSGYEKIIEGGVIEPCILAWLAMDIDPQDAPAIPLYHRPPDAKLPGGKTHVPPT